MLLHARALELLEAAFSGPLAGSLAEKYDFSNLESFGVYSRAALFYQFFDSTSEGAGIPEEDLEELRDRLQHDISSVPMFTDLPPEVVFYGRTVASLRRCLAAAGLEHISVVARWARYARRATREPALPARASTLRVAHTQKSGRLQLYRRVATLRLRAPSSSRRAHMSSPGNA